MLLILAQVSPITVPPNVSIDMSCSQSPPIDGAGFVDEGDSIAYTTTFRGGAYLILTGPRPSLTLNRRGGNINTGSVDFATGPNPGFVLIFSQQTPFRLTYECQSLGSLDAFGAGPLTVTITGP